MANKLRLVSELAGQTAHNVARSARSWEQYLDTASRLYKYPFDEQLLIYAQRPDATACASMELWNGTMRRWVRSGSSGIALIRKSGGRPHLEYVFDVSDTRPVEGARTPWLWELREEHHAAVVAALERRYGPTEESGIANQLMDLAEYAVREVYRDHLRDLAYDAEGSLLDGLDDLNLEVRFRNLMTASVQYTLLRRCGLNPGDYLDDDDLAGITEFTTPAVLHHLGEAVSSVSKDLLMEIGRSIRAYEQEARKNRENNLEKPLANQAVIGYTEVTRNFSALNHESEERGDTHERDEYDGADVHEGRGLSDSRSGDGQRGRSGGDASGQVRDAAGELPEAGASRDVHLDAADGAVGAAPAGDRPAGTGAGGQDRERPDEARRRERGAESEQSDGVGAGGQQLHGAGRGNGADGDRLQVTTEQAEHEAAGEEPAASLSMEPDAPDAEKPADPPRFSLFPTVEEQVEAITEAQAEERRAAAEEPAQLRLDGADRIPDAVIGRALTAGSNERDSIKRIVAHFQKDYPIANSAAFLKEEFGTGGKGVTIAGQKYALWYDGEGVHIAAGNRALTPNSTTISWTDAALLISDLLRKGMYATQENIDGARGNEFEELAQKLAYMRQDFSEEAREQGFLPSIESAYSGNGYPEITLQITELLRKPESRAAIMSELRQFADSYALNGDLLRFRRIHDPETLWARLFALDKPIAEFHAVEAFEPVRASFITEDEIDELLKRSGANRIDDGKLGLFSYILQGHNAKECTDYMRRQYGDGGFGRMGYDEWHDSKGIRYRRDDDASGFSGYDTVFMNWNQVYKRVRQLIDDGRYLNEKEQGYLHAYEMKMLARNVYAFQYYTDTTPQMNRAWDVEEGIKPILPILEDPAKAKELYDQMLNTWMPLRSDFPHYDALRVPLRDMGFYVRGEYSLFKPLPEKVLQAERDLAEARKQAKREARQAGMVDDDDDEPLDDGEAESGEGTVDLNKAARSLARKQKPKENEEPSGQFNLFGNMTEGEQASLFDTEPEPPAPPAQPAEKPKTVVDVILSPDLEQERRSKEAARKQAEETLAREGISVPDKVMEYITNTLGRDAINVTRIEEMARTILDLTPDPEAAEKYKLGYGQMGNGLTVWNSLVYEHGDYKTVAHIGADRSVEFYDPEMPESVRMQIVHIAATSDARISATQDAPVFSVPPMVREQKQEMREAAQEAVTEQAEASVPEQPQTNAAPQSVSYRVGDVYESFDESGALQTRFTLTGIEDDYIYYTFPDLPEQEPVKMWRDTFELYLHRGTTGGFLRAAGTEQPASEKKRPGQSRPEKNYRAFARQFPEIINGEYRYLELRAGADSGYMPLIIQYIGENEIAVAHTYRQNGDVMNDPEMTFRIDRDKGALEPLTYQQDALGLYQRVYPEPGKWIPKLRNDLSSFTEQWLKNIEAQGRTKYRAIAERDGGDVTFSFDKEGNPIAEVDPFPTQEQRESLMEVSPWWVEYLDAKAAHPDDMVLYQVGDFFEMFGEDAKQAAALLDLQLGTRPVAGVGRVAFCGIPVSSLERFSEKLREQYDLAVSAVKADGSGREVYKIPSIDHEAERDIDAHEAEFGADGYRAFPSDAPDKMTEIGYDSVKEAHPEELVLYQVEDSFELRGEDAKTAARLLKLTEPDGQTVNYETTSLVSFPVQSDANVEVLRSFHDLVICTVNEDGQREVSAMPSRAREAEQEREVKMNAPDRFSVRPMGVRGLNFGIWDAALGRFYEEGNKIAVFVERNAAEAHLASIERTRGTSQEQTEPETAPDDVEASPSSDEAPETTGTGAPEAAESEKQAEPNLVPNVEQYIALKAQHPNKLVGVQVDRYMLFYGKDAVEAARALGTNVITRDIPGLGLTEITGSPQAWQATIDKLLQNGQSAVLARPGAETGAPYEPITVSDAAEYIPIGLELTVEGRRMKITSVDYEHDKVEMQDMELKGWYPIFRTESVPFVRSFVEEYYHSDEYLEKLTAQYHRDVREAEKAAAQAEADAPPTEPEQIEIDGGQISAPPTQPEYRERTVKYIRDERIPFDIEIRTLDVGPERHNFRITDDNLCAGGQKTKYQNNVAAIRTLKQIEAESRLATPEEQETLSRYVGWGGIAQAFDPDNDKWAKEYAELKELLTPEEYESARGTVLNAHYTSPTVIKAIYDAVEQMDFQPGNVLEPACGIGNFFGLLPEAMSDAKLYGVELDSLTGRIARQLYQQGNITVDGFEHTDHPDDFFDLSVGNVPFGSYHVHDKRYDKQNLLIHDYFLMKTLDKTRPGGIMAFVTSKGTMDKKNSKVREALAQKADLLGAIRLPNNAFKDNAGTEVTTDILFFQKRDRAPEKLPEWVESAETEDGIPLNRYYLAHPEMVLGKMVRGASLYGNDTETACEPIEGAVLSEQLAEAIKNIAPPNRELLKFYVPGQDADDVEVETIPADPDVRNFSFTMKGDKTYYRENSRMRRVELGKTPTQRVRGMIAIRDSARKLIDLQLDGASDEAVKAEQVNLNRLYDQFTKKYGLLSGAGNRLAFNQDSSYPLLCSLEVLDDEGNLERKADMFTKRTIQHHQAVTSVDTASEALAVSIGERACVDLGYMAELLGGADKIPQIVEDLKGVIFKDPATGTFDIDGEGVNWYKGWQTADEYLSGNVRQKLEQARIAAEMYPEFAVNAEALEKVQPKELTAAEISVRVGAPWIKPEYYRQFIFELLKTPPAFQRHIGVLHSKASDEWRITNKGSDTRPNPLIFSTFGTKRRTAYEIFENMLNQRDTRVFDDDGNGGRVLNVKETTIAGQKQEAIAMAFQDWIFKDPERRADLAATYNRLFNSTRPREYNGEHIRFAGMNPEIRLEPHQRNAVARMLYGGNTLLAHCVGAGKTFEMTAAAMESKRLGLCQKSLFVVPNHLTEQWGGDFLQLYPGAKVLVATKKDFEPKNRRKFCARIATGDFDAVIIGHSQFEKIPLSAERQKAVLEAQIDEIMMAIAEAKEEKQERFTIKQMERTRKNLESKLKKLNDKKKDDTVTFEELGVDRLFVDEAHYYKNLFMFSKMRNVAGISQTEAQKSSDMFAKCRYLDEITGGKGVTFATGTPISNTMVELYTMMRYLQFSMLDEHGLSHFDDWAATFGEKVTSVELKPEGTGFRAKTRFARFFNLPELMNLWKEAADIQTADMLKLPVPEAEYITISTEPSAAQKEMVKALAERAEAVRRGDVDPSEDNMLKITSDGRKLALDQRIANPLLPDDPNSKVNACVNNVFQIWQETTDTKGTQLIFSDLSTPKGKPEPSKGKGKEDADAEENPDEQAEDAAALILEMSVYEDIRAKLIAKGVPSEQIAFIHQAHTEAQKAELFAKVRAGQIRVLLGSTQKMGAGTNVQTHLVASHDLDCPWRPADLEQRAGRIVRRGNENDHVRIFRYVTKGTFDAYNWGLVENKQKFIGQVMTSKSPARSIEDVDATALSYAEVKMIATGDPRIKEKLDLDIQVAKLKLLKSNHMAMKYDMEDKVIHYFPRKIKETELFIEALSADLPILQAHPVKDDTFSMTVLGTTYTERKDAGQAIVNACMLMTDPDKPMELGEYRGFPMVLQLSGEKFKVTMKQHLTYTAELSNDLLGNVLRINNALEQIPKNLEAQKLGLSTLQTDMESAKEEAARPFPQDKELEEKSARLSQLNLELDNEEKSQGKSTEAKEGEDAPARDGADEEDTPPEKPSIRAQLRAFTPPARVTVGTERAYSRGTEL